MKKPTPRPLLALLDCLLVALASIAAGLGFMMMLVIFLDPEQGGMTFSIALTYMAIIGVVIAPVILVAVYPLAAFSPRDHPLGKPIPAAVCGAAAGVLGIYLWYFLLTVMPINLSSPNFWRELIPDLTDRSTWLFAGLAVAVGSSGGFTLSLLNLRHLRRERMREEPLPEQAVGEDQEIV